MATGAILEAAMKIDPNVDKKNLYSAVSKLTRNGTLTQTGATSKSKVYSLAGRRRGAAA